MFVLTYPSSSAVFGAFLAIGTFFFAIIRAYYKPLILLSIFGTIAMDIFCVRCIPLTYITVSSLSADRWPSFPFCPILPA
jgi:hypothetical protein